MEKGWIMKRKIIRVRLEPVLEQQALLWTPARRRAMAAKFERWARQLRVSASILEPDCPPRPPLRLLARHLRKPQWN
jgi:hypothetical protein